MARKKKRRRKGKRAASLPQKASSNDTSAVANAGTPGGKEPGKFRRGVALLWWSVGAASAVVGLITGLSVMKPQLTLQPAVDARLGDPKNGWWFKASNNGWFTMKDVYVKCACNLIMDRPDMPSDRRHYTLALRPKPKSVRSLQPGESFPVPCASAGSNQKLAVQEVAVQLQSAYQLRWWPFWRRDTVLFGTIPSDSGLAWAEVPRDNPSRHFRFDTPEGVVEHPLDEKESQEITIDFENVSVVPPK